MSDQSECDNLGSWFNSNPSNPVIENDGLPSSNVKRIGVFTMEKYYFNDFVHHVNTHSIFYSEKDAITAILPYARRVIMILNVAKREAYIKENDSEVTGIRWTELTANYKELSIKIIHDKKITYVSVWTLLASVKDLCYIKTDNIPYNTLKELQDDDRMKDNTINTFIGFKAKRLKKYDVKLLDPIFRHIREVLANGDDLSFRYILEFYKDMIVNPSYKKDVAIVLFSEEGTGKNYLSDFLKFHVFGDGVSTSAGPEHLLRNGWNSILDSKILVTIDEVKSKEQNKVIMWDDLKDIISNPRVVIRKKNISDREQCNTMRFIFTTNNEHSFHISKSDRRFSCFEVSDKYKQDASYHKPLRDATMNDHVGDVFYSWCLDNPAPLVDLRDIPKTKLKESLMESSISNPQKFMNDFKKSSYEFYTCDFKHNKSYEDDDGSLKLPTLSLYTEYIAYCKATGKSHSGSIESFTDKLKKDYEKKQKRIYEYDPITGKKKKEGKMKTCLIVKLDKEKHDDEEKHDEGGEDFERVELEE